MVDLLKSKEAGKPIVAPEALQRADRPIARSQGPSSQRLSNPAVADASSPTAWTSIVYARRRPSIPQGGERGGEQPTPERYDLVAIVENDTERKRVIGGVPQAL